MKALVGALRPSHWAKQVFVLASIAFVVKEQEWSALPGIVAVIIAWSLAASVGYLVNDLKDIDRDRQHPVKKHRPIPSGRLPIPLVVLIVIIGLTASFGVAYFAAPRALPIIVAYIGLTFLYNFGGKHIPIIDLGIVGVMYGGRVAAGFMVMTARPEGWELWALLAALLAFVVELGKRRSEVTTHGTVETRPVLVFYKRDGALDTLFKAGVISIMLLFLVAAANLHPVLVVCGGLIAFALHRFWRANASLDKDTHPMYVIMRDVGIVGSVGVFSLVFGVVVVLL